jgi:hypothetical protein
MNKFRIGPSIALAMTTTPTIREEFAGRKATPEMIGRLMHAATKLEERVVELEAENKALCEALRSAREAAWSKR